MCSFDLEFDLESESSYIAIKLFFLNFGFFSTLDIESHLPWLFAFEVDVLRSFILFQMEQTFLFLRREPYFSFLSMFKHILKLLGHQRYFLIGWVIRLNFKYWASSSFKAMRALVFFPSHRGNLEIILFSLMKSRLPPGLCVRYTQHALSRLQATHPTWASLGCEPL